jgi:hypothetical protein
VPSGSARNRLARLINSGPAGAAAVASVFQSVATLLRILAALQPVPMAFVNKFFEFPIVAKSQRLQRLWFT